MDDLDAHADSLARFHKRLTSEGVPEDAAGVVLIDLNKAILAGNVTPKPDREAQRQALDAAAEAKRQRRTAQIEGTAG